MVLVECELQFKSDNFAHENKNGYINKSIAIKPVLLGNFTG